MAVITGGQIMRLTGLILRSSLSSEEQSKLLDKVIELPPKEVPALVEYLEMNQLDLTQLSVYNKDDINKRLDKIDLQEKL